MTPWPFDDWLRLAVHVFRLSPDQFWTMSVRDWMRLSASERAALSRTDFAQLCAQFPDGESDESE